MLYKWRIKKFKLTNWLYINIWLIWGDLQQFNCNEYSENMIFWLQKRAARIVTWNCDFIKVGGQDIMNELGWQTLDEGRNYYVSSIMFKSMHILIRYWLNNNILMACENHDRNTCFANNMNAVIPKSNVETFRNSFMYQGAISWNSLP